MIASPIWRPDVSPKLKILHSLQSALEKWKSDVKAGKAILEAIVEEKKGLLESKPTSYSFQLQSEFFELRKVVGDLKHRVENLQRSRERVEGHVELERLKRPDEDSDPNERLLVNIRTIVRAYEDQCDLNQSVLRDIGFAQNEDELVYYLAIWVHQPGLGDACSCAEKSIHHAILSY